MAGWSYQWICQLDWAPDSWTAHLDVMRVAPSMDVTIATIAQVDRLVGRLPNDGDIPLLRVDDALKDEPSLGPWRPRVGIEPKLTDAELVTVAMMQAMLGFTSETRWLRHANQHLGHLFPYLPGQAGYNKRLRRAAGLIRALIRMLGTDTSLWTDDTWLIDSPPVECGRSRPTAKRSELAAWAGYGYCAYVSMVFLLLFSA